MSFKQFIKNLHKGKGAFVSLRMLMTHCQFRFAINRCILFNLVFLFAFLLHTSAQTPGLVSGKVVDDETGKPLPGVSIRIAGTTKGTVTNADGIFVISEHELQALDRLIISHIGYERDTLRVANFRNHSTVWLHSSTYQLMEIEVSSKRKSLFPYQLLYDAIRHYRQLEEVQQSKAYLLLQSESNGIPLEILEAYYNSSVSASQGIEELTLVNGRIGISSIKDKNYLSLNTTELLQDISPFYDSPKNPFPESPGNLSFARFKRLYDVSIKKYLKRGGNRHFIVEFTPKKNNGYYFSGVAYINESDLTIDKLEYWIPDCQVPLLHPIDPNDRIRTLQIAFALYFDNSWPEQPKIDRISLGYEVGYINTATKSSSQLQTRADLFLYDYQDLFLPPILNKKEFSTDYQAILSIPYMPYFWQKNAIMAPSAKQLEILEFFRQQGILVNFSDQPHEYLNAEIRDWSPEKPLNFSDLTGAGAPGNVPMMADPDHGRYNFQQDLYRIDGDILIQPFVTNDTVVINSKAFLHQTDSYYYGERSQASNLFINLLFDLYEVFRKRILIRCLELQASGEFNEEALIRVYSSEMKDLEATKNHMKKEIHPGLDQKALIGWAQYILDQTGVDRLVNGQ